MAANIPVIPPTISYVHEKMPPPLHILALPMSNDMNIKNLHITHKRLMPCMDTTKTKGWQTRTQRRFFCQALRLQWFSIA